MIPCIPRWTPAAILVIAGSTQSLGAGPFGASFELSSLDGTNGFVINGINAGDWSGRIVSNAGDLNGDGVDDIAIGAMFADPNGGSSGQSYVIFGGPGVGAGAVIELTSLNGTNGFTINGASQGDKSGFPITSAGDINGDGFGDLAIGAYQASGYGFLAGESYVVFGSANIGASGVIELSSLDGTNGFVTDGVNMFDYSGASVSSAGDINGDGVDDLIVGAPKADQHIPFLYDVGESYVFFGSVGIGSGGILPVVLDGSNGFIIRGIDEEDQSGFMVSSAGDVNGDGADDLIIGAAFADPNGTLSGESYVVFGGAGVGASGTIELSSLDGSNGFVINGMNAYDLSGRAVSAAGDVNGDGVDDVIIGALRASPNGEFSGQSYVVFGSAGVGAGGTLELSSLNGTNGFIIDGIGERDSSGSSVSAASDVNGDGIDDIIIGAPGSGPLETDPGKSYVIYGGAGIGSGGTIDLLSLDGFNGFVINGITAADSCGASVSSAGDVNGDGVSDLIIGAPNADPNGQDIAGESYVVFGRTICPSDLNADRVIDTADLGILLGEFNTAGLNADINGDGVVDTADLGILLGAFGIACP